MIKTFIDLKKRIKNVNLIICGKITITQKN